MRHFGVGKVVYGIGRSMVSLSDEVLVVDTSPLIEDMS